MMLQKYYIEISETEVANMTTSEYVHEIVAQLKKQDFNCEYSEVANSAGKIFPVIKLPFVDGTLGDMKFPFMRLTRSITDVMSNVTVKFHFGYFNNGNWSDVDGGYTQKNNIEFYSAAAHRSFGSDLCGKIGIIVNKDDDYYSINYLNVQNDDDMEFLIPDESTFRQEYNMLLPNYITHVKDLEGNTHDCMITVDASGYTYYLFIGSTYDYDAPQFTEQLDIVLVSALTFGKYYSDIFHITWPKSFPTVGAIRDMYEHLQANSADWLEKAFRVDGDEFDIQIGDVEDKSCLCIKR